MPTTAHPDVPQITLPGQAAAAPGPLDMTNMYLAHYGFRRDLGHLLTSAGRVRLDDRRRIAALREHHAWVLFVLHHHHTAEDETVWPKLRERAPHAVGVIDALEAEHEACDHWIGESTDAFRAFEAAPSEQGRERLMTALRTLADILGAHLAHEESDGIPLMMAHITPEEDAAMHQGILKEYGFRKLVRLVGWTTFELPADAEAHLRRSAPGPLLLVHRLTGGRYRRRMAALWG
ncbi:hemerythrin domain-containing protein [Actinomadura sp. ATCC 31491]|uniref:Hemerythrin domain-containing protein n=1 Tax=Actinomadura luzonensis TaxID=2805427 RepID=A0ABT0G8M8_9ACTN|nr:hemerythrin domain-containing protein [Actinomadura luzonensis]MCK2220939.1 hemerythrin domain-containing protein [Actinomadura luzonensis]